MAPLCAVAGSGIDTRSDESPVERQETPRVSAPTAVRPARIAPAARARSSGLIALANTRIYISCIGGTLGL